MPPRHRSRPRLTGPPAAAAVLVAALVAGCTSAAERAAGPGERPADPSAASTGTATGGPTGAATPPVLQPGRPGEPAATLPPDAQAPDAGWNRHDAAYLQGMIPHHGQALVMSRWARARAEDERVRRLADRIRAGQGPEIAYMSAWLEQRDQEVPAGYAGPGGSDHGAHGADQHGMLTDAQMTRLEDSRGRRFDVLFLRGMIRHHLGAIEMSVDLAGDGLDRQVQQLAADVAAGQAAELVRLRDVLADLA